MTARGLAAARTVPAAFLAGAGVLSLEITGARALVPWFGSSIHVWTNVIGVTLAAVAAGNFVGGRWADRSASPRHVAVLFSAAALLTALSPFCVEWIGRRSIPANTGMEVALALLGPASLLAALTAFGPPLVLLGAATPFLVRLAYREGRIGRTVGLVSAAATIGSLVGTWAPVHVLVPHFGSARTLWITSGCLLAAALLLLPGHGGVDRSVVLTIVLSWGTICVPARGAPELRPRPPGVTILEEGETPYQYYRVERQGKRIVLRLNEGLDSFHSLTIEGSTLTAAYFDYFALFFRPQPDRRVRAAVLGHAAGTIPRILLTLYPQSEFEIIGVEIDPEVAALGPRWFGLPEDDSRLHVVTGVDARVFVRLDRSTYDLIAVDAYGQQIYVPFQLCTQEFFSEAREHLREGGWLVANLSAFSPADPPLAAILNTAAAVFERVGVLKVPGARNFLLVARRNPTDPLVPRLQGDAPPELRSLSTIFDRPGSFHTRTREPDLPVLTDDDAPIEWMFDRSLLDRAERILESAEPP